MMTSSNAADQSAAAGCDAARQLRETALPLPRGSEQSREEIARVIDPTAWEEYLLEDGRVDQEVAAIFADAYEDSLTKADQILALLSTAHAEGLGKEDEYGVQTHVEPQHCTGWRDIDSAPRDETRFLAWGGGLDVVEVTYWSSRTGCWCCESCTLDDLDDGADGYSKPTHWMPLPAEPSIQSEAEGDA